MAHRSAITTGAMRLYVEGPPDPVTTVLFNDEGWSKGIKARMRRDIIEGGGKLMLGGRGGVKKSESAVVEWGRRRLKAAAEWGGGGALLFHLLDTSLALFLYSYILPPQTTSSVAIRRAASELPSLVTETLYSPQNLARLSENPFGLKLNAPLATNLSSDIGTISFAAVQALNRLGNLLPPDYIIIGIVMPLGLSFAISLLHDGFTVLTSHLWLVHKFTSTVFKTALTLMTTLWKLTTSKKSNPLRVREDSYQVEGEVELMLIVVGLCVLVFLQTTVTTYAMAGAVGWAGWETGRGGIKIVGATVEGGVMGGVDVVMGKDRVWKGYKFEVRGENEVEIVVEFEDWWGAVKRRIKEVGGVGG
ncbi:hypothetical protein TrCOL_g6074 [Triparma columacea]|uniref:Uncharacterized protein n=1 Tax=Triparma columacea TaxID=722753 RepID=A0A9W7L5K9_9STRA|nr:hypothetical protein TrCOL_g6074 [Triparma columacea]